uniref:Uncharacterized protein LOC108038777 n=1 Tax=Drosophila rhopaloa TaxID=1041015 RepID=A0A6P4ECT2_DRORH
METIVLSSGDSDEELEPSVQGNRQSTATRDPRLRPGTAYAERSTRSCPTGRRQPGVSGRATPSSPGSCARTSSRRAASNCAPESSDSENESMPTPPRAGGASPHYTDAAGHRIYPTPYECYPSPAGSAESSREYNPCGYPSDDEEGRDEQAPYVEDASDSDNADAYSDESGPRRYPTGKAMEWESEPSDDEESTAQRFRRKEPTLALVPYPPPPSDTPFDTATQPTLPLGGQGPDTEAVTYDFPLPTTAASTPSDTAMGMSPTTLDLLLGQISPDMERLCWEPSQEWLSNPDDNPQAATAAPDLEHSAAENRSPPGGERHPLPAGWTCNTTDGGTIDNRELVQRTRRELKCDL